MRVGRTELVEKTITTYSCDMEGCKFSTEHNSGCCGVAPVMKCCLCEKDVCGKHRHDYFEDSSSDYANMHVCEECHPDARRAWVIAEQTAGRYDSISDVTKDIFARIRAGEVFEEYNDE